MTDVVVIEVDLGSVDKLISDNVAELSGDSQRILDDAFKQRKQVEELGKKRKLEAQKAVTAVDRVMADAYQKLEEAGENGVPCDDILEIVQPKIANASAFTLRMKKILREGENKYIIKRKKINKIPHYVFEVFG